MNYFCSIAFRFSQMLLWAMASYSCNMGKYSKEFTLYVATWRITDKWRGGLGEWAMSKIQKYNLISCIFNFLFIFHNECPQQQQSIASNARTHTIEFAACAIVRKRWWLLVLHCPQSAPHRRSRRNNNRETAALRWELTRDKKFT